MDLLPVNFEEITLKTVVTFAVLSSSAVILVLVRYWQNYSRKKAMVEPPPNPQSVEVEGTDGARRSAVTSEIISRQFRDVTTVYEGFLRGMSVSDNGPCLGTWDKNSMQYTWLTYSQVHERATHIGAGLVALGCEPSQKTFIGIYGPNCTEWVLSDLGCQMFSMISVPLYDTHGSEECLYIINHAELSTIVCKGDQVPMLLEHAHSCKGLKNMVKMGSQVTEEENTTAKGLGIRLISFEDLEDLGKKSFSERKPAKPEDVFTICYTSGTTGTPKGAIMTHQNIVADISAFSWTFGQAGFELTPEDIHLSFLPLAHMYERAIQFLMFVSGMKIGFFRGDVKLLLEDFKQLRPTFFSAVPRLLNRIYDKVTAGVAGSKVKSWIFQKALESKENDLKRGIISKNTVWDYLVFRKIQNLLGGRVRQISCGSAPLSAKVTSFTRCVMGCQLSEGYGQTEATCAVTFQMYNDPSAVGHVGPPLPCNIVKVVDVEEMEYFAKNGQGEICVKGPNVFKGYFKDPEKTAETIDKDGWLHTGDIGEWLPNGTLRIIDRKKNIFKLSQGEYIAPEKIENVYLRSPFIAQVFVCGNSLKSFLVAIVVPDAEVLETWARSKGLKEGIKELCQNETVYQTIFQDMRAKGKEGGLNSLEQVKKIRLHAEMFSIENGLLTPTMKAKRLVLQRRFEEEIDHLYEQAEVDINLAKTKENRI